MKFKKEMKTSDIQNIALPTGVKKLNKFKDSTPKDAVFVCLDASCPRFDLVLDVDETIRGFRNSEGHLVFTVPAELAERARKHFHVTNGRLVES